MDGEFFLTTLRLGFRAWRVADIELASQLWGDAQVMALLGGPYSSEQVAARIHAEIQGLARDRVQYWPIFWREDGRHVGCCGLRPWSFGPSAGGDDEAGLELGFHLKPEFWGQGIAYEAARSVVDFARDRGERFLFAGHHPHNEGSKTVLTKLGFQPRHTVFYPPTGLIHPTYRLDLRSP